jgi:hypothetical protein
MATRGWSGEPRESWLRRQGDAVVGAVVLRMPDLDDRHLVELGLLVDPARPYT